MWIETCVFSDTAGTGIVSPASNGGCGLKLLSGCGIGIGIVVSPASNGGCGLKQVDHELIDGGDNVSPASNGGCGLKPLKGENRLVRCRFTRQ